MSVLTELARTVAAEHKPCFGWVVFSLPRVSLPFMTLA